MIPPYETRLPPLNAVATDRRKTYHRHRDPFKPELVDGIDKAAKC
jgi:hypothetical protein